MFGVRSSQAATVDGQGLPSDRDQLTAPVSAFRLYTQSFSVATITEPPTANGWA